jgi:hypothetical protein
MSAQILKIIEFQSLDDRAWISASEPECESVPAREEVQHLDEASALEHPTHSRQKCISLTSGTAIWGSWGR